MCSANVDAINFTVPRLQWLWELISSMSPQAISATAAIASAVSSLVVAYLSLRTARREKLRQLSSEYRADHDKRKKFWNRLRRRYCEWKHIKFSNSNSVRLFNDFIDSSEFPPSLDRISQDFQEWLRGNRNVCDGSIFYKFSRWLYGQEKKVGYQETGHSKNIYDVRSDLTRYWDSWTESMSIRYLKQRFRSNKRELKILCWLEVVLGEAVGSQGMVKRGFYTLADAIRRTQP
jgi:hypothetical protein